MKIKLLTTGIALLLTSVAMAQSFEVSALSSTKEEFIKSEPDIINAAKWLEATPIGTQMSKILQVVPM